MCALCPLLNVNPASARATLRIEEVSPLWFDDEHSDAIAQERLGHYAPTAETSGAISRIGRPEYREHEYPFWIPVRPEYALTDYQRHESLSRGEWSYQGFVVRVVVSYQVDEEGNRRIEVFSSGGQCGIESDSSQLCKAAVEVEQFEELKHHLQVFDVPWTEREEMLLQVCKDKFVALKAADNHE